MFRLPFAKLFCAAALTSAALVQGISIVSPIASTQVDAGAAITIELTRPTPSDQVTELSLAIGVLACNGPCSTTVTDLGPILYTGNFNAQWTDSNGNQYDNITVTTPNYLNGPASINVAHFFSDGMYGALTLEYATSEIDLQHGQG